MVPRKTREEEARKLCKLAFEETLEILKVNEKALCRVSTKDSWLTTVCFFFCKVPGNIVGLLYPEQ